MNATDEYVATFPDEVRPILTEVAEALRRALPGAEERIRYGMPAFMLSDRYALHFAGWKHHVGLYPVAPAGGGPRGRGRAVPRGEGHGEAPVPRSGADRPRRADRDGVARPAPVALRSVAASLSSDDSRPRRDSSATCASAYPRSTTVMSPSRTVMTCGTSRGMPGGKPRSCGSWEPPSASLNPSRNSSRSPVVDARVRPRVPEVDPVGRAHGHERDAAHPHVHPRDRAGEALRPPPRAHGVGLRPGRPQGARRGVERPPHLEVGHDASTWSSRAIDARVPDSSPPDGTQPVTVLDRREQRHRRQPAPGRAWARTSRRAAAGRPARPPRTRRSTPAGAAR